LQLWQWISISSLKPSKLYFSFPVLFRPSIRAGGDTPPSSVAWLVLFIARRAFSVYYEIIFLIIIVLFLILTERIIV